MVLSWSRNISFLSPWCLEAPGHGLLPWAFILLQLKLSREGPSEQEDGRGGASSTSGTAQRCLREKSMVTSAFQGRFAPIPAEPQPRCPGALEAPAEPQQCSGPSPADLGLSKASPHPGRAPAQGQAGKALGAPLTVSIPCFQRAGMAA